jgi:dTDP-4-amino-4,6-dideoxygalactose transaminase
MTEVKVPFIDLKQRFQEEKKVLLGCIEKVLESGHLVMTNELVEFEDQVAEYTNVTHCIGLNSGTDALMMGLMSAGVSRGDEVITSPISFVATTGAIAHVGAKPIYVDVGPDQNIDPKLVEAAITPKTKAIMPVHWAGRIADMKSLCEIAERHGLAMLEDSAQCMGAYLNGQHGGTFGLAGAISLHPLKNLNALGDGGLLLTDNDDVAKKVRLYRNHGLESRDSCVTYGVNSRLDILNAEILKFRLKQLKGIIAARRKNASLYRELITAEQVIIPDDLEGQESAYVMFITMCEERDKLQAYLKEKGIESLIYYGTPLHLHPAAKKFEYQAGDFPIAEAQADRVLALPHHQYVTREQIEFVANSINEFYLG